MLNPDGRLWIDRLAGGLHDTGEISPRPTASASFGWSPIMSARRSMPAQPRVSAELPETGERFEGLLPPVVAAPAFAIRKPAVAVFTLDDYVAAGIMRVGAGGSSSQRRRRRDATSWSLAGHRPARPR